MITFIMLISALRYLPALFILYLILKRRHAVVTGPAHETGHSHRHHHSHYAGA